jgi:hypothetical protein
VKRGSVVVAVVALIVFSIPLILGIIVYNPDL